MRNFARTNYVGVFKWRTPPEYVFQSVDHYKKAISKRSCDRNSFSELEEEMCGYRVENHNARRMKYFVAHLTSTPSESEKPSLYRRLVVYLHQSLRGRQTKLKIKCTLLVKDISRMFSHTAEEGRLSISNERENKGRLSFVDEGKLSLEKIPE